jgi:hypothetical protein
VIGENGFDAAVEWLMRFERAAVDSIGGAAGAGGSGDVALEAAEEGGEPGATADGDNTESG